jgi:subtilisin family serine protease
MKTPTNAMMHTTVHTSVHTTLRLALLLVVALCATLVMRPAFAASLAQEVTQEGDNWQTLLVHFDEGATPEIAATVAAEMGGELVAWMHQIQVAEIRVPVQAGVAAAAVQSSALAQTVVTYAESDFVVEAAAVFNDPDLSDAAMSYGLTHVKAVDAWNVITGSQQIVIAVIDTGVKLDHPEFAGRLVAGYDFVNDDELADDDMGHGTHVAGIIAAALNNGQGVAGVCPNCRLMPVKVLDENNIGSWSQLAQGILFAVDNGARVLNLSLGATISSETLASAIQYAHDRGVIVVAAAGNNGSDVPFYPAALDSVIAVGGTTDTGERWARSNYGTFIDLVAPASLIYSAYFDMNNVYHGYTYMSGTSMAAPFVSGVAGLLLSANPNMDAQQVEDAMTSGATDLGVAGWDVEFGDGQVNALNAVMSPLTVVAQPLANVSEPKPNQIYLPVLSNN